MKIGLIAMSGARAPACGAPESVRRRKLRRPNSIITCTAALALVLTGCSINIEATDLTAVTVENDRTVIEKTLGKPSQVVEAQGFTVASYTYDKGYSQPAPSGRSSGGGGGFGGCGLAAVVCVGALVVILVIVVPIAYAVQTSEAKAQQKGQLAAIFDVDEKLLFARLLEEPDPTTEILASIAARFNEAQSGDAAALIELSKVTLIPGQKRAFLETAASTGSAKAAFELGEAYNEGAGVERDLVQARVWYAKAAGNGDTEAAEIAADLAAVIPHLDGTTPEAKYALALAYERDSVFPVNLPEAERLLRESAEEGYAPAQALYGDKILASRDDRVEALKWHRRAAEQGYARAQALYGDNLASRHDPVEALKWHRLAAEQGYAPSQTYVGLGYLQGDAGVSRDKVEALKWFNLAAAQRDEDAEYFLRALTPSLSAKENAKAQRLAKEWLTSHTQ